MKKHFDILGLKQDASQEQIQEAYDRLSKELNPSNNDNQEFFVEEYEKVEEAYNELRNSSILTTKKGVQKPKGKPLNPSSENTMDNSAKPIKNKLPTHKKSKLMNTYSKIIGVILTLVLLVGFGLITFFIIDNSNFDENLVASLLYIPCIAFLHYMYLHNFGFNLNSAIPKTKYRVILILSIISFVTVLIMPTSYFFKQNKIIESFEKTIDRGEYSRPDYTATLKTKYENRYMYYVLTIQTPDKSMLPLKYKTFSLEFFDIDGFKIKSIQLKDGITNLINDDDQKYGIKVNSSVRIYDIEIYSKIADWGLVYNRT